MIRHGAHPVARATHSRPRRVVVEKCKWDGTVTARELATAAVLPEGIVWYVRQGTRRRKLRSGREKEVVQDQLWLALPEQWSVLCCYFPEGEVARFKLHAAIAPGRIERRLVRWTDLDLDVRLGDERLKVEDERQFCDRAEELAYTPDVIAGVWQGVSTLGPSYMAGTWPFDGWLESTRAELFGPRR